MRKLTEPQALLVAVLVSILSLFLTLTSAVVLGKQSQQTDSRDVKSEAIRRGRQLFVQHCAECHGFDARGDQGSDLHNLRSRDILIRQIITDGIKGEMPAYREALNNADVQALVSYLRSLKN